MTGRLVVRSAAGAIAEHPVGPRLTIGSSAPSDVVVDAAEVLPLHATVEMRDGRYWVERAGEGPLAINGQAVDGRALQHLDVVTLGAGVHMIFRVSAALPPPVQTEKRAAVAPRGPQPGAAKTVHGVPVAAFKPRQETSSTRTIGIPLGGPPPPAFAPKDTQVLQGPVTRTIASIRLQGPDVVYEAATGASLVGRGANATIRIDRPEVSRAHAVLKVSATRVSVEDAGSSRGTAVNGTLVTGTHALANGDVLTIGKLDLRVEFVYAGGAP